MLDSLKLSFTVPHFFSKREAAPVSDFTNINWKNIYREGEIREVVGILDKKNSPNIINITAPFGMGKSPFMRDLAQVLTMQNKDFHSFNVRDLEGSSHHLSEGLEKQIKNITQLISKKGKELILIDSGDALIQSNELMGLSYQELLQSNPRDKLTSQQKLSLKNYVLKEELLKLLGNTNLQIVTTSHPDWSKDVVDTRLKQVWDKIIPKKSEYKLNPRLEPTKALLYLQRRADLNINIEDIPYVRAIAEKLDWRHLKYMKPQDFSELLALVKANDRLILSDVVKKKKKNKIVN